MYHAFHLAENREAVINLYDITAYEDLGADRVKLYLVNGHTFVIVNKISFQNFKNWFDTQMNDEDYPTASPDWPDDPDNEDFDNNDPDWAKDFYYK